MDRKNRSSYKVNETELSLKKDLFSNRHKKKGADKFEHIDISAPHIVKIFNYNERILMFLHSLEPGCCCKAILPFVTFAKSLKDLPANLLFATSAFHSSLPICPS